MNFQSRTISLLLTLTFLSHAHLHAGGRRRAVAVSPPSSGVAITFVDGVLDAGTIAWAGGRRKSSIVRKVVSMRLGEPSLEPRGTATVRAFLEVPGGRCAIRVNGVLLSGAPQIVLRHAPIGSAFPQRIEIEVPNTMPEGPLHTSIGWEVTTN